MAPNRCPACLSRTPPLVIVELTRVARVNYYRCPDCWHVWTTTKDGQTFLSHVTTPPDPMTLEKKR